MQPSERRAASRQTLIGSIRDEFSAYRHRTALVTGADGFIGSHLSEALIAIGADVHALVRPTSSGALNNIGHLRRHLTVHWADLTDRHAVNQAVAALSGAPDAPYVFHLGAQAHVGESWQRPYETLTTNTIGTLNLLQAVVDQGIELEKLDTAGSSEEYGNVEEGRRDQYGHDEAGELIFDEGSPINPKSIYATSKLAADFLTLNYHDAYGLPALTTRMFNNYGPRQNPRYITGTIITQALSRPRIELGSLEPRRDFCYSTDGVRGHLASALYGKPGSVYCYGSGQSITIKDWAELILEIGEREGHWAKRELVSRPERFRPGSSDVMALRVNHDRLTGESGWRPTVSREEGLRRTIAWYAANSERWIGQVDWALSDTASAEDTEAA